MGDDLAPFGNIVPCGIAGVEISRRIPGAATDCIGNKLHDVVERIVDDEYERPVNPVKAEDADHLAAESPAGSSPSLRAFSENLSSSLSSPYSSQILAAAIYSPRGRR